MCETGDLTGSFMIIVLSLLLLCRVHLLARGQLLYRASGLRFPLGTVNGGWRLTVIMIIYLPMCITILPVGVQLSWTGGLHYQPETCPAFSFSGFFIIFGEFPDLTGMQILVIFHSTFLAWGTLGSTSLLCHAEPRKRLNLSQASAKH